MLSFSFRVGKTIEYQIEVRDVFSIRPETCHPLGTTPSVREEFATYYPLVDLVRWLGGDPFVQIGKLAVVNLQAIEQVTHYGDRLYRVRLRDRVGTEITA